MRLVEELNLRVTILILIDWPLQSQVQWTVLHLKYVTILILIDWPLQLWKLLLILVTIKCHNPYFNRLTFAIMDNSGQKPQRKSSHNPYFNRLTFAIKHSISQAQTYCCHNPYFNRLTFAIHIKNTLLRNKRIVTILILIDWPLQYIHIMNNNKSSLKSQSLF